MPMMPPHRCPSCHQLVAGRCGCRPPWRHAQPVSRIRGRRLQRLRHQLLSRYPLCVLCLAKVPACLSSATIRDHIVPLAEGGTDTEDNVQAICVDCSDTKTQQEARRGQRRTHAM